MRMHSLVVLALSTLSLIAARPHHHHHHHHHHTTPHTEAALVDVTTTATVYLAGDGLANVVMGVEDPNGDAYGRYTESVESTGWGVLNVVATSKSHDFDAMFAVGYLEGYITAPRIYQSYVNTFAGIFKSTSNFTIPQKLVDFEQTNIDWMRQQIIKNWKNDRYWFEAGGIMAQLDGLLAGYNAASPPSQQLSYMEMYLLSQDGDMEDLHFLIPKDEINPEFKARGDSFRCSSLVKVAPGNSDLYVGHDTWDGYGNMLRVYKHYDFDLQTLGRRRVSFSGYFAWLSSVDDWYINHNNLVITETTNGFRDKSLENLIVPTTVLSWIRCMIATYAAAAGPDWHWYFSRYNSGTYNNQWIIVDMKLFTPNGTTLVPNTLTISESLPGYFETADVTQYLQTNTYWASYNVPYFPDIYNKSGFSQPNEWATAPRAQIFKRDQGKITNFQQFQDMMNYNDYKNDPISKLSPTAAIAARGDLATRPRAFGAVDMKVTSSQLSSTLTSIVRSGPSTSNNRLPPFEWTDTFNSTVHIGQPQLFNFTTIQVTPYAYGL